jgi:hypothetical protein
VYIYLFTNFEDYSRKKPLTPGKPHSPNSLKAESLGLNTRRGLGDINAGGQFEEIAYATKTNKKDKIYRFLTKNSIKIAILGKIMMKKRDFVEFNMIKILGEANSWVEVKDLTFEISQINKSYRITPNLVARVAAINRSVVKMRVDTISTTKTLYRLIEN